MRYVCGILFLIFIQAGTFSGTCAADRDELMQRRTRAAKQFADGVLLLHAKSEIDSASDGYRVEPAFYYLSGMENLPGALLAIDGKKGESWLFVNSDKYFNEFGADVVAGPGAQQELGIAHVVDWTELESFLAERARAGGKIYYQRSAPELPANLATLKDNRAPAWIQVLQKKWPELRFEEAGQRLSSLMDVQSAEEQKALRAAAGATTKALIAGVRAIHPGATQRGVESVVESACWKEGAHGSAFWPWAMAGENSVFPKPFASMARYDHLESVMQAGDLVRLDVGCEWEHYQGDLGRTVPVSGHYSDEQREIWNAFVAAYRAGVGKLREGTTEDQVFDAWKAELLRHRDTVKSRLAKQAIESWSERKNVPYWQAHTTNLDAGYIDGAMRAGMTIDFEPIASIGGQGYYLEDMFLITKEGAEILTPGLPYSAEEIEAAMSGSKAQESQPHAAKP
jgi:Xaa-Pro aminopeptidase